MSIPERIQRLVNAGKTSQAERLLLANQTPVTPYQLNSAKGLRVLRKGHL
jgi:hypothetical protein